MVYTKHRIYRLPTIKFDSLNSLLEQAYGCVLFKPLNARFVAGRPIKGGIDGTRLNSGYRPRFYWAEDTLMVMIADSIGCGGVPGYSLEQGFWGTLEDCIRKCGGSRIGEGQGLPPTLPPNGDRDF